MTKLKSDILKSENEEEDGNEKNSTGIAQNSTNSKEGKEKEERIGVYKVCVVIENHRWILKLFKRSININD